ncbi:MAG: repressor LexA [Elusimicrobia bacterium RIFCSPHIGHO2_02_FULL_57_9]|nr:MAG: repressor LexA [Elusimicrobia bacterium RIFCSPHIGHO2_02_FULL_57_9]
MNERFSPKEIAALRHIRNWLVHDGHFPSVRELMALLKYKSPRSAALVINRLIQRGVLRRRPDGELQLVQTKLEGMGGAQTVDVPLVGSVPCGLPVVAEENVEAMVRVSTRLARPPHRYFLLRAKGDSMNGKGIREGDLILVRQQATAQNGEVVVALIDGEVTVKEYRRSGNVVLLIPRSTNREHRPIVLTKDAEIQGVVMSIIPDSSKLASM